MRAELEALERIRAANPVPDDERLDGHDLRSLFAAVEERRPTMSTGMRERDRAGEEASRRRLIPALVFAAALVLVLVGIGLIPLLLRTDDEIAPAEQISPTTVPQTTAASETPVFDWSPPVMMPWFRVDGSQGIEVVGGPTGYLAHVVAVNSDLLVRKGGRWVLQSEDLALSSDGVEWVPVASKGPGSSSGTLLDSGGAVTATDSEFLVLGSGPRNPYSGRFDWSAYRSADGRTWDEIDLGPVLDEMDLVPGLDDPVLTGSLDVRAVTYGDAGYVAIGSIPFAIDWGWTDWVGVIAHSSDGREWTVFHGERFGLGSIDLSQFVVGSERDDGYVLLERRRLRVADFWSVSPQDVVDGPSGYVAVGFRRLEFPTGRRSDATVVEAAVWFSPDGTAWEPIERQPGFEAREMRAVTHGPGGYVAIGDGLWLSTNGRDWRLVREDIRGSSVAAGVGGYVAVTALGDVWFSPNGTDWSEVSTSDLRGGHINGVSVLGDRLLLTGTGYVDGVPTPALWWGSVND